MTFKSLSSIFVDMCLFVCVCTGVGLLLSLLPLILLLLLHTHYLILTYLRLLSLFSILTSTCKAKEGLKKKSSLIFCDTVTAYSVIFCVCCSESIKNTHRSTDPHFSSSP